MTKHCCEQMDYLLEEGRVIIFYIPAVREYAIETGKDNYEKLTFCPWCGTKFKDSLSEKWYAELKKLGFNDPLNQSIPDEYKDETWWRKYA